MSSLFFVYWNSPNIKRKHIYNKKTAQDFERFAVLTRLELATSCVTGRHSNQTELQHLLFFCFINLVISLLITGAKIQPFFKSASTFSKKINYFSNYFTSYWLSILFILKNYFIKKAPSSLILWYFIPKASASSINREAK